MTAPRFPLSALLALAFSSSVGIGADGKLQRFVFEKPEMGMPFRITLHAPDKGSAKAAADAAFKRVAELNLIFSDYDDESELSRLSRSSGSGTAVKVSEELWTVVSRAHSLAERTGGAYDATCGPLVSVWRRARRKHELPSPDLVTEMRSRIGWQKIRLDEKSRTVELTAPEMRLDLGSIAKGRACDEALKVLRSMGCSRSLVAGSGDMVAGDAPPGRKGWRIEVESLPGETPGNHARNMVVEISNSAIATSGDRYQRLEIGGKRYSHILDLRTGQPLTEESLVTVIAPDGLTADSLATAVAVLGPSEGIKLVRETPGAVARVQRRPEGKLEITQSPGWTEKILTR